MSTNRGSSVGGLEVTGDGPKLPPAFLADLDVKLDFDSEQWIGLAAFSGMKGLDFGGSTMAIPAPALDFSAGGAVAVAFVADTVNTYRSLFYSTAHTDKRFGLQIKATGELRAAFWTTAGTVVAAKKSVTSVISAGTRYIVVVTYDGASTMTMRLNGVAQTGTLNPDNNQSQLQTTIGARGTGDYFDGRIAAVLAEVGTGVPWSAAEITAIEQWAMTKYGF